MAYASEQPDETEQALEESENLIGPVLTAAIIAALAAQAVPTSVVFSPLFIGKLAAKGLSRIALSELQTLLVPLVLARVVALTDRSRPQINLSDDFYDTARESVDRAIELAQTRLQGATDRVDTAAINDLYDQDMSVQRKADAISTSVTRWVVREAMFHAQAATATSLGYTHKRWITERDARVRPAHRHLDGIAVEVDQVFRTRDGVLRYPGDITAPPHLVINCRCSLEWLKRGTTK